MNEAQIWLKEATLQLLETIAAGDLDDAQLAVEQRAQAIAAGATPTDEIVALGEHAAALLQDMKRAAGCDEARLAQVQQSLGYEPGEPHISIEV